MTSWWKLAVFAYPTLSLWLGHVTGFRSISYGLRSPTRLLNSAVLSTPAAPVLPKHVAFIVDGNGRWAQSRGLDRLQGHAAGANVTVSVTKRAFDVGVETVSLYLFSTENWRRPSAEVAHIFVLLERYVADTSAFIFDNGIRMVVIGAVDRLPQSCRTLLDSVTSESAKRASKMNSSKTLVLALSYGGRADIVEACRRIVAAEGLRGADPGSPSGGEGIDEETFSRQLSTGRLGIKDPDLIVRTSGEFRLSNFFLWQAAYAEFAFIDKRWPDLSADEVEEAVRKFSTRGRRFGLVS